MLIRCAQLFVDSGDERKVHLTVRNVVKRYAWNVNEGIVGRFHDEFYCDVYIRAIFKQFN